MLLRDTPAHATGLIAGTRKETHQLHPMSDRRMTYYRCPCNYLSTSLARARKHAATCKVKVQ